MPPSTLSRSQALQEIIRQAPAQTARSIGTRMYREAYEKGMNLSQLLENMDPTSEIKTEDRDGLDAFGRVMREAGIVTQPVPEIGLQATEWQSCVDTPEKRALMPEYMARVWRRSGSLNY